MPIPTYYGDEICHVNGLRYAKDVATDVTRYRLHKVGLGSGELAFASEEYELKLSPHASHGRLLVVDPRASAGHGARRRVLPTAGSGPSLATAGHHVVGVDRVKHVDVGDRLDTFVEADLNQGLPLEVGTDFDVIVAADVLEHTVDPARLLGELRARLAPDGVVFGERSELRALVSTGASRPSAVSTTTGEDSSTPVTSDSSPAAASSGSSATAGFDVVRRCGRGIADRGPRAGRSSFVGHRAPHRGRRPHGRRHLADHVRLPVPVRATAELNLTRPGANARPGTDQQKRVR